MLRRTALAAALIAGTTATTAAAAPLPAGPGPGTASATSIFTLEPLLTGASNDPRVLIGTDGTALTAFGAYPTPKGAIHVCLVPRTAAACTRTTTVDTADGPAKLALVDSVDKPLLVNGTANYTETYASADGGATFGPAVRISRYTDAENVLPLPDGRLMLVGTGNDDDANQMHVVTVPRDGSGVDVKGFRFPAAYSNRSVAFNAGRPVVVSARFRSSTTTDTELRTAIYNGSGDLNDIANWTLGTLPLNVTDPPALASGPSGTVLVAPVGGKVIASKLNGTTFGPPVVIGDALGGPYLPNVTQDATGRLTATWQVNGVGLRMSQSFDGVSWSRPITINRNRFFNTDTATAPDGGGLAVTKGDGRYEATRIYRTTLLTVKADKKKVTKGKAVKLSATLSDDRAKPIAGAPITFLKGTASAKTVTTNAAGTATYSAKPKTTATFRARYAGTAVNGSYLSNTVTVKVVKKKQP